MKPCPPRVLFVRRLLAEKSAEKHVEMVNAVLSLHRIAAAIVRGGLQAALDGFANVHVFLLNRVTESDGFGGALASFF